MPVIRTHPVKMRAGACDSAGSKRVIRLVAVLLPGLSVYVTGSFASAVIKARVRCRSQGQREHEDLHAGFLDRVRRHPVGEFRRPRQGPRARHDRAALHRHARCRKARSRSCAPPAPKFRRITSCWRTAASCNAFRKPSAPGMPACRPGPAKTDINSCSIGIEIVNRGHDWGYPEFPLRQIAAVIALCRGIMLRRKVPSHRVLAHSDVAPARKKDPGEKFPVAFAGQFRRRPLGAAGADRARRNAQARHHQRRRPQPAAGAGAIRLRRSDQRKIRRRRPWKSSPPSSAISVPRASTASPTIRP